MSAKMDARKSDSKIDFVRLGALVKMTGWSAAHLRRLAHQGKIPGTRIRDGKKMKFLRSSELTQWADRMKNHETKKDRKARLKREREARLLASNFRKDGRRPTGTGYSNLLAAEWWARRQGRPQDSYDANRANAVLADIVSLSAFIDDLRAISKRAAITHIL